MINKKVILLILGLFLLIQYSQVKAQTRNDLIKKNINGPVKSIKEMRYKAVDKFGEIQKGAILGCELIKYNNKGNVLEKRIYWTDGSLIRICSYKRDSKGNKIGEDSYDTSGKLNEKSIYNIDFNGNIIEENVKTIGDSRYNYKFTYKYDIIGNQIERCEYNSDGNLKVKYVYKYDIKGYLIEILSYNSGGSFDSKDTFTYKFDKKGNWVYCISFTNKIASEITEREITYYY
jgi:hypothetical protein